MAGLICGHIHHAAMRTIDGYHDKNTGDWVENCTALVEDHDGRFQLLHWSEERKTLLDEQEKPAAVQSAQAA